VQKTTIPVNQDAEIRYCSGGSAHIESNNIKLHNLHLVFCVHNTAVFYDC
jgi:hypothetical protein